MKKILLASLLLLGCAKQEFKPTTQGRAKLCVDFDMNEFMDTWTWRTRQYQGQQVEQLDLYGLQNITIQSDTMWTNGYGVDWTYMDCSIIDQQGSQLIYVEIYNDTMTWTGINDGTIWTLTK